ncbi:MAG TPA: FecR domain-containing protein [Burkholderiaceae bacterium]
MKKHAAPPHDTAAQDEADAREFEDYARTQDPVLVQAALWATRRTEGLDAATEAEFQEWLRANPEHADAYEEIERSFYPVREIPGDKVQSLKEGLRQDAPTVASAQELAASPVHVAGPAARPVIWLPQPASPGRRAWMVGIGRFFPQAATAVTVVALVSGGWMSWNHWRGQPTFAKNYATGRGQRLDIQLPDGSTLQLDAATQVEVRLYRARREVRLLEGQTLFIVHADPRQPFDVLAGAVRVTVVGTRFSVRHTRGGLDAGKTVVAVESGRVRVSRVNSSGEMEENDAACRVELIAGQGVTADETGRLQTLVSVPPDSVAGWRNGRISFNDIPLAEALAELERYGDTGLVVRDPAVGALRLGGSFDLRQTGAFAHALPSLLPVRLERRDGAVEIVGLH